MANPAMQPLQQPAIMSGLETKARRLQIAADTRASVLNQVGALNTKLNALDDTIFAAEGANTDIYNALKDIQVAAEEVQNADTEPKAAIAYLKLYNALDTAASKEKLRYPHHLKDWHGYELVQDLSRASEEIHKWSSVVVKETFKPGQRDLADKTKAALIRVIDKLEKEYPAAATGGATVGATAP